MSSTETADAQTRQARMRDIEAKHFDRCLWQIMHDNRRVIVEGMSFGKAQTTAIVVKHFETPIPKPGSGKPWPELMASYVYLPVDDTNTWDGLDAALTAQYK